MSRHDSAYLLGAICPARAVSPAIVMPFVGSEAMRMRLAGIATQASAGAHAVLVCDSAGWHQSGERLIVPNNITLLRLPPYAPELNPIVGSSSRIWTICGIVADASCPGMVGTTSGAKAC